MIGAGFIICMIALIYIWFMNDNLLGNEIVKKHTINNRKHIKLKFVT